VWVLETGWRLVGAGARAGRSVAGVALIPARLTWDATRPWLEVRVAAAFEAALAGPMTEQLARSLGEHRVIERVADELIAQGTVTALFDQALQAGLGEQIATRLLAQESFDRRLLLELTDRVMASDEIQHVIAHVAGSPELRAAMAEQSTGLAQDMVAGVRERSMAMDDAAERVVRGWLRRTRPRPKPA